MFALHQWFQLQRKLQSREASIASLLQGPFTTKFVAPKVFLSSPDLGIASEPLLEVSLISISARSLHQKETRIALKKISLNQHINAFKDLNPTKILHSPVLASSLEVSYSKDSCFFADSDRSPSPKRKSHGWKENKSREAYGKEPLSRSEDAHSHCTP